MRCHIATHLSELSLGGERGNFTNVVATPRRVPKRPQCTGGLTRTDGHSQTRRRKSRLSWRNGMPTLVASSEAVAVDVSCSNDALTVVLDDGRTVSVPLVWFPRLLNATGKQRKHWEFIGGGVGIHWEEIDEDISIASLLNPERFMRLADTKLQPLSRAQRRSKSQKNSRAARG